MARLSLMGSFALGAAALATVVSAAAAEKSAGPVSGQISFSGVGWVQYGQIGHSSDTTVRDYNGNSTQNSGAQISVAAKISDDFTGAVGLGVFEGHALAGPIVGGGRVPISSSPYIAEARFTYRIGEDAAPLLQITAGLFPYNYNANIKDLGLYLLRGPVYPGILISGFETKEVLPISNILGMWFRNTHGVFTHDLLFVSETEVKPYFDISVAYIGKARISDALTVGAGINLYHLIPSDGRVSHDPFDPVKETREQDVHNPYQRQFIYVDSNGTGADTTYFGFDGTKLMANVEFDPKPLFGLSDALGPEDLKLYSEAAVMGLSFDKAHKAIYGSLSKRVPITVGFNFPAFRFLDHLALEVEWYGAEFRDDLYRLEPDQDRPVSPIPFSVNDTLKIYTRDNVKWALHAAKTIEGHFKISAQVANDHFRPNGTVNPPPTYHAAFSTLSDWYWMTKIAYFF